jgi:hypothetical protein
MQTKSWGDLKGAYRLLSRPEVSHTAVCQAHWVSTRQQATEQATVLFVQDTSTLDFSSLQATEGLGQIGDGQGRGMILHSCLAVVPKQAADQPPEILGLAGQRLFTRGEIKHGTETRTQRTQRWRESQLWQEMLTEIGPPPNNQLWVSVGDRASDVYSYMQQAEATGWKFLLRVSQNRRSESARGEIVGLIDQARSEPEIAQTVLQRRGRDGQVAEEIVVAVSCSRVWVEPPWLGADADAKAINAWCIRCWGRSSDGRELEWILLTNVPVEERPRLVEVIGWYQMRWIIEEYHKCLKTGCQIEARQLQRAGALEALVGFAGIIAVRLLILRTISRQMPEQPADRHVDMVMLRLLVARLKLKHAAETMSMRQFWHATARLGGFLARTGDGDPGWQTLWAGWQRLSEMAWAATQAGNPP